ncbi:unnamed protein product [Didymodactylos carnosus]|nr:unnamed protein product [Didymodactylos carnosus]CAF4052336.1 unnamed protein product [Didymodactylos carnosus]
MIKSGEEYARQIGSRSPLMYKWHNEEYLGAAHGLSGILYILLKATQQFSYLQQYIGTHLLPTIEYLKTARLPSGNYRSSTNNPGDKLVQFCHGAPGFVYLFIKAYEVIITGNTSYLQQAVNATNVIWHRGILRKGYSLCHGTAGNGYIFLALFKVTQDMRYLHRAIKFAEWILNYGNHPLSIIPDNPLSLFQGLAGTLHFMADVLTPRYAYFPAFE